MTHSTQLKEWITRPEIEQMFHISSSTFSTWRAQGRFGDTIGTLPGRGGVGRDLNMYSMTTVMKLYEILKFDVARRAIAKGVPANLFPEYCAYVGITSGDVESRFTFSEWVGVAAPTIVWIGTDGRIIEPDTDYSDDTPYYDGLPITPSGVPSQLGTLLAAYLDARKHTLSTAHLTGIEQMLAEAEYVLGEAQELVDAVKELAAAHKLGEATAEHLTAIRKEVADVALADTTFASLMPGGVTVEACIAEKTEADRGRG